MAMWYRKYIHRNIYFAMSGLFNLTLGLLCCCGIYFLTGPAVRSQVTLVYQGRKPTLHSTVIHDPLYAVSPLVCSSSFMI